MFWVNGQQIDPGDDQLTQATTPNVADAVIRDYTDWNEVNAHAAGATDHVGNLPGPRSQGTWLRFPAQHLNILGEDHTEVDLRQVKSATGFTSFVYERFACDVMAPGSNLLAAYDAENNAEMAHYGIAALPNRHLFGGESLYPKIGTGMVLLRRFLPHHVADLRRVAGYDGKPVQRYLKIGWGLFKDIAADVHARVNGGNAVTPAETHLRQRYLAHTANPTLDTYITGLVVDTWLGDTLDTHAHAGKVPAILDVAAALIPVLLERAAADQDLGNAERLRLAGLPLRGDDDLFAYFGLWRNLHFARRVREAAAANVRYAGMGSRHLTYLLTIPHGIPANASRFYMDGAGLANFETTTGDLRQHAH
ncbi:hypothetical protein AB0I28_01660 [Phytomonospora sp. NPDC050363]|uniref:hypothetical protein n=1 Tax=Phytomonospora sp. NPDC050363 TaxID=3155642 RepID=UPI00341179A0